jgi:hypothetical protein
MIHHLKNDSITYIAYILANNRPIYELQKVSNIVMRVLGADPLNIQMHLTASSPIYIYYSA